MRQRGSWRVDEQGELHEQPQADYAAEAERQMLRMIEDRDEHERRPGQYA